MEPPDGNHQSRQPSYLRLHREGVLESRAGALRSLLGRCTLCPRRCGVDRLAGETGFCGAGPLARVASAGPHFGEESPLVGTRGSGTVFFSGCNLGCVFCQNADISHMRHGVDLDARQLAETFLAVQDKGCHNLNLVTPTHVVPQVLEALLLAIPMGFSLPLVYNCGGHESPETLALLDGIVDIYMPDLKLLDARPAARLLHAPDYPERAREAIVQMHRQVGDLALDERGIAYRGLLVRHLVMPGGLAATGRVARFLAREVSTHTYLNVMGQYHPCHHAADYPEIARRPSPLDLARALSAARQAGIRRLDR